MALPMFQDPHLRSIYDKVAAKVRLDREDGLALFQSADLLGVGALAQMVRQRLHGRRAYYIYNQHVNYSNICINGCKFCAFSRKAGEPGAYEMSLEEIFAKVEARATTHHRDPHRRRLPSGPALFLLPGHAPGY